MHDAFASMVTRESPVVSEIIMTIIMQRKKAKKNGTIVLSLLELRNFTPRALAVYNFYIC